MQVDTGPLLTAVENQRVGCMLAGSDLYASALSAVAADITSGGPSLRILTPVADAPFGDAVLLRMLAAVHDLVLDGLAPELAAHYPSAGGTPGPGLVDDFLATLLRYELQITEAMGRGVQTNEVGRSVALLGGWLTLARHGLPLRVLEIGASAGLNLRLDRYRYEHAHFAFGPIGSAVRFQDPFVGAITPDGTIPLVVSERRGCDLEPIDPTTADGQRRLRSLVWPDQPERRARLDAAMAEAERVPVAIDRADAVDWLRSQLAEPVPGVITVVMHSITFQYLSPSARSELLAVIDQAGARATSQAPFAWLRTEPGGPQAETRLTEYPGGTPRLLATSSYHGPPVAWLS
ncbi:MAG: DUF2332 domain-containing protein [Aquihabitans sp.]